MAPLEGPGAGGGTPAPPAAPEPAPMSFPRRVLNVFGAPGSVGEALARRPRALGALVLALALVTGSVALLHGTATGRKLVLDQMRDAMRRSGQQAEIEKVEANFKLVAVAGTASAAAGGLVTLALLAGVLWIVFSAAMGAGLRYRHYFAIAAHAALISGVGALTAVLLMLSRGTMHATLSLAAFVPRAPIDSPLYMALALFDFFTIWWLAALGIMAARAGGFRPGTGVAALLAIYFVLGGAAVAVRAALS